MDAKYLDSRLGCGVVSYVIGVKRAAPFAGWPHQPVSLSETFPTGLMDLLCDGRVTYSEVFEIADC